MSKSKTTTKKVVTSSPATSKTTSDSRQTDASVVLPFGRMNYILLIAFVAVIALGFFLMSLDDFVDATQFSVSLHIAPIVVVAGFVGIIYAIMYKPATSNDQVASE
ncbi:MAG: DUF3098 domain-containing protein [Bacteroidia bacterium]